MNRRSHADWQQRVLATMPKLETRSDWAFVGLLTLLLAVGVNHVVEALADWHLHDMNVYRDAARRLLAGEALYGGDVTPLNSYRYAPWFAYLWVPIVMLPELVVNVAWSALMLGASLLCVAPLAGLDRSRVAAALFFAPVLFAISSFGNVQPLLVALMLIGIPSRWGWLAVGIAGSLKVVPLAYCAVFLAERRWRQAAGAVAVAAVLWAPMLWLPVGAATYTSGPAESLPGYLWVLIVIGSGLLLVTLAFFRSRLTGVAAGTAAVLTLPRLFVYDVALLLPGISDVRHDRGRS